MGLIDTYKQAFNLWKKDIISSSIFGLILVIASFLLAIPLIGNLIYAYVYPRIVSWYYKKITGEDIKSNYNVAFKAIFISTLLIFSAVIILSFLIVSGISISQNLFLLLSLLFIGVGTILEILWLYNIYGSILGKVDSLKIDAMKSLEIFFYLLLLSIIILTIVVVISFLFFFSPIIGSIIILILDIIFFTPVITLVALLRSKGL
jgi:hypothetical protein